MKPLIATFLIVSTSATLLAACADTAVREQAPQAATTPKAAPAPAAPARAPARAPAQTEPAPFVDAANPTGIPECDQYLERYVGCHHAIGTYAIDQLDDRYEATRASLIERSRSEPAEQLAENCASLVAMMDEALDDRECGSFEDPGTVADLGFEGED